MLDPIIITGVPRSRTSMVTALLNICGLQLGKVNGPNSNNKKGQFENREIIDKVEKFHLRSNNFDPMGQYPLPKNLPIDTNRKNMVIDIAKKQKINLDENWGFKDPKAILSFDSWLNAFPNSVWVIVHRNKKDIVKSCELTPFMKKRKNWAGFVDDYRNRFAKLKQNHEQVYEINSDEIINYKFNHLKYVIEEIGLTWNKQVVREFVDPKLTRI